MPPPFSQIGQDHGSRFQALDHINIAGEGGWGCPHPRQVLGQEDHGQDNDENQRNKDDEGFLLVVHELAPPR